MTEHQVIIIGAGAQARVILDILDCSGRGELVLGLTDADTALQGSLVAERRVIGGDDVVYEYDSKTTDVFVSVGDNPLRARLYEELRTRGYDSSVICHPAAVVSERASVSRGTLVCPGAIINCDASVGEGVIVNSSAVIEHDCIVGDYSHIAPGSTLAGGVFVGKQVLVGVGANVLPGIRIGNGATVAAGATVIRDVPEMACVGGVPAVNLETQ